MTRGGESSKRSPNTDVIIRLKVKYAACLIYRIYAIRLLIFNNSLAYVIAVPLKNLDA
jgi:hypothetical protein